MAREAASWRCSTGERAPHVAKRPLAMRPLYLAELWAIAGYLSDQGGAAEMAASSADLLSIGLSLDSAGCGCLRVTGHLTGATATRALLWLPNGGASLSQAGS